MTARSAPLTVVVRRWRSKLFHVSLWNTQTDRVQSGSWFNGKLYPDRCGLSPDGRWLVYFAMGGHGRCWTGVSRPPFLRTEVHLLEPDTWGGGGDWLDSQRLCLSSDFEDEDLVLGASYGEIGRLPFTITTVVRERRAHDDARKKGRTGAFSLFKPRPDPNTFPWTDVIYSEGVDPRSATLSADGELLIARCGMIERWSRKDVRAGKPGFALNMEGVRPPWRVSDSTGKPPGPLGG